VPWKLEIHGTSLFENRRPTNLYPRQTKVARNSSATHQYQENDGALLELMSIRPGIPTVLTPAKTRTSWATAFFSEAIEEHGRGDALVVN
jgi:hypothetical protein